MEAIIARDVVRLLSSSLTGEGSVVTLAGEARRPQAWSEGRSDTNRKRRRGSQVIRDWLSSETTPSPAVLLPTSDK